MVPSVRKHSGKSGKQSMENQLAKAYDKTEEKSGSEVISEGNTPVDKRGKKRPSAEIVEDMGGEVQNMLEKFGADINKALLAKRKRLEMYAQASFKTSNQKIEQVWKTQREQRQKLSHEYSQHLKTLFQQWDTDMQIEQQEEKLANLFRQQQKIFQQSRIVHNQRMKTFKQLYEQFVKNLEDLEKDHENLLTGTQSELKKEMALLQKKIMMEIQQQEMASVRKSLQSMLL